MLSNENDRLQIVRILPSTDLMAKLCNLLVMLSRDPRRIYRATDGSGQITYEGLLYPGSSDELLAQIESLGRA